MPWSKISLRLGSPWIPSDVMERFAADLWGDKGASIKFVRQVAKWSVKADGGDETARKSTWGVTYTKLNGGAAVFSAGDVMEAVANNRAVVIKENLGSSEQPNWVNNDPATEAIRAKIQDMAAKFKEWIWEDEGRRERLATIYNENYNTDRRRVYDGSHLTLPGSSPNIQLRKHQKSGVWRAITDRVILLDQVVGAGKTFEMAAIAMELRRLGIARKPMFAVPNSLVKQWRDEFYKLYPNANVLAATEADFAKANRKRFFAKIATGDWDAVIVAHSSFKKVGAPAMSRHAS
jgi:N12 class adenine-specific DNA methylase